MSSLSSVLRLWQILRKMRSKRLVNHPAKDINISNMKKKIKFTWEEKIPLDTERVGVMYCFHRCDVNKN